MAKPPAVVIVARHGMRLDAADSSWHMSTPTPYDPPLTYGGWNQCRVLGIRIASLLHAREQSINAPDHAQIGINGNGVSKRKRKKHKVVIHTSPFLRCLQTSVAISAGIAQYEPPKNRPESSSARTPSTMHSASPRLRAKDHPASPNLAPISEPRHHFQRDLARRALGEQKPRYRQSKIRVDAWLGEWLNPSYFDQITPPPPSPMMVASAKAELMQDDPLDVFSPTLARMNSGSLWTAGNQSPASRESTLDDWSHVREALDTTALRRQRSNSEMSVASNDTDRKSSSGRKSPFRPGHTLQRLTSLVQTETTIYQPPTPSYAVASSDMIPKGYVTHARTAAANVDYHWDSSRPPQNWGDGGEYGEEWSSMHKRVRRGLNELVHWYGQHNADDRGEDALGFDQADRHHDDEEEEEELVVILVTHAAGCNALIGALTQQPVLLDMGMASLTMAVRKDEAPALLPSPAASPSPAGTPCQSPDPVAMDGPRRRSSLDIGLSAVYDMKLVASSEHLRPGSNPSRPPTSSGPQNLKAAQEALARYRLFNTTSSGTAIRSNEEESSQRRSNTSTAIGSIRRPSATKIPTQRPSPGVKSNSLPPGEQPYAPPTFTTGLWTPPSGRGTPQLTAQKVQEERKAIFTQLNDNGGAQTSQSPVAIDFAQSPPISRPASANGGVTESKKPKQHDSVVDDDHDHVTDLPKATDKLPPALSRGLSQKHLWGKAGSGDQVARRFDELHPKRRWTVNEND